MRHCLKILEDFAEPILTGEKTFEIRENDRGFQKGDLVKFKVLYRTDKLENINHPLSKKTYEITYVLNGWGLKDGAVVFGIREVKNG